MYMYMFHRITLTITKTQALLLTIPGTVCIGLIHVDLVADINNRALKCTCTYASNIAGQRSYIQHHRTEQ